MKIFLGLIGIVIFISIFGFGTALAVGAGIAVFSLALCGEFNKVFIFTLLGIFIMISIFGFVGSLQVGVVVGILVKVGHQVR